MILSFILGLIFKINLVNNEVSNWNSEKGVKGVHKDSFTL